MFERTETDGHVYVGDIFTHTYGYDCALVSFWQVTRVMKKTVELTRLQNMYRSEHLGNTSGDFTVPGVNGTALAPYDNSDFIFPERQINERVRAFAVFWSAEWSDKKEFNLKNGEGYYEPWRGEKLWVNCR